jgi:phosphopentomutase
MRNYKKYQRIFGIVLDSVGTGAAIDADKFNDTGGRYIRARWHGL